MAHVKKTLTKNGLVGGHEYGDCFIETISHAYPRFRLGFQTRRQACLSFLHRYENFISYGRQGGFSYLNVDGAVNQDFRAASSVLTAHSMGYTCYEWFAAK
jgi:hypothetical protein